MDVVLKIHKKGIVVLPKSIREAIGVKEGDNLIAKVEGSTIILKPLMPKRVKLGGRVAEIVRSIKKKEVELEA